MTDKTILFDADILCYRCGFSADSQAKKEYGADKYLERDYLGWALGNVKEVIVKTIDKFPDATHSKLFLSGKTNFRDDVATIKKYKGNRDASHKPKYYSEIRQYLVDVWKAEITDGYEADDALGVEQFAKPDRSTIIVTVDKDLNMIPGWHYNWVKDELFNIELKDANRNFYWQMLVGDTTDNIPGIRGIGPKNADKLLRKEAEEEEWRKVIAEQYAKQYGGDWQSKANEVAMLLWMWRKPNDIPPLF